MKKTIMNVLKGGLLAAMLLIGAQTASAATWSSPTATPPGANTDAPINVGGAAQTKTGFFRVNGGFYSQGSSLLEQHVDIGVPPCPTCALYTPTGTTGGGATGMLLPGSSKPAIGGFFSGLKAALSSVSFASLKPEVAYAVGVTGECQHSYDTVGTACGVYTSSGTYLGPGTCQWNDTGSLYCSLSTGGSGASGDSSTSGTLAVPPVISFNSTAPAISTGSTSSLTWSVTNASACAVTSTNPSNNWNSSVTVNAAAHTASGTHGLGTFAVPGSYTYYMTCSSPSGGTASSVTTITAGPTYILDVWGNSNLHGYINVTGRISAPQVLVGGKNVCLKDGTNCPTPTATNIFPISSTPTSRSAQGAYIGWNSLTGGTGETDFINNQGLGSGGFAFMNTSGSGSTLNTLAVLKGNGNLGIGVNDPSAKLAVHSDGDAQVRIYSSSGSIGIIDAVNNANSGTRWLSINPSDQTRIAQLRIGSGVGDGVAMYAVTNSPAGHQCTRFYAPTSGGGYTNTSNSNTAINPGTLTQHPKCGTGASDTWDNTLVGYLVHP